jgi:large subunit ribosomal protein L21
MFAVVRTGGKQYRVAAGDKIVVEKLAGEAGDTITLGDVLIAGEGAELRPTDGLTVSAEIIAQAKGEKVIVFKKRRRHNYRRKKGHRQQHTILKILGIGDEAKSAKPKKAAAAKGPAAEAAPAPAEETNVAAATPAAEAAAPAAEAPKKPRAKKADAQPAEPNKIEGAESEMTDTPAPAKKRTKKAE